jgi:hypothetical protein
MIYDIKKYYLIKILIKKHDLKLLNFVNFGGFWRSFGGFWRSFFAIFHVLLYNHYLIDLYFLLFFLFYYEHKIFLFFVKITLF